MLSHVRLFATLQTAECQAFWSFTVSWSLFKLMSIELVMLSEHLTLCHPLLLPSVLFIAELYSNWTTGFFPHIFCLFLFLLFSHSVVSDSLRLHELQHSGSALFHFLQNSDRLLTIVRQPLTSSYIAWYPAFVFCYSIVVVVQPLSPVQLFVTLWTAARRLPSSSLSPGVCSNSCPLSQ